MIDDILDDANKGMDKTLEALDIAFKRIRTGRANTSLLDAIEIDYYGNLTPLKQVSNISIEDASNLSTRFSTKSYRFYTISLFLFHHV